MQYEKTNKRKMLRSSAIKKKSVGLSALRIILLICVFIVTAFCIYYGSKVVYELSIEPKNDPLSQSEVIDLTKQDGISKTIVIIEGENLEISSAYLIITNDQDASSLVLYIPPWVYMDDYSTSFNSYISIRNLIYIGNTINPDRKYEYALWQIQNLTAVSIDSYIIIGNDAVKSINATYGVDLYKDSKETLVEWLREASLLKTIVNYDKFKATLPDLYSNMTLSEMYGKIENFKSYFVFADEGSVVWMDLSEQKYWNEVTLETGEVVRKYNAIEIDKTFAENVDIIRSRALQKELVKVEVFNGSGVARAAERYSRRVNNTGCTVVRFGNAQSEIEKTKIYIMRSEDYASSFEMIKSMFSDDVEISYDRPSFMTTGDIIVVLGKDISNETEWK